MKECDVVEKIKELLSQLKEGALSVYDELFKLVRPYVSAFWGEEKPSYATLIEKAEDLIAIYEDFGYLPVPVSIPIPEEN